MLTILPTVDVEGMHGSRPFEQMILGELDDGSNWGVHRIAGILRRLRVEGTFFVDVYEHVFWGEDKFRRLCRELVEAGQDVQLHTHPAWRDDPDDFRWLRDRKAAGGYLDQRRDFMFRLSYEEQVELLKHGMACLLAWTGRTPTAHRAGGYGLNADTIRALRVLGVGVDSSMHYGHENSKITWSVNSVTERDGVVEFPVTLLNYAFRLPVIGCIYRKQMKTDLDTCSLAELKTYVEKGRSLGLTTMNLFMHSYSLLRFDSSYRKFAPDPENADKLRAFLDWAKGHDEVRVMSCAQALERYREAPHEFHGPDAIPDVVANRKIASLALTKFLRQFRWMWRNFRTVA